MVFISIILLLFTFFILYLILFIIKEPKRATLIETKPLKSVSVVIPFRNEAANLKALITSLCAQDYKGEFELLFVNDGSDDNSLEVIEFCKINANKKISIIESNFNPLRSLTSKQQALETGINMSEKDWIALTDADMILASSWLSILISRSENGSQMVFGHTSILPTTNSFFEYIQSYQLDFLFSIAYSFHISGIPGSCMGNNMAFARSAYLKTGGYSAMGHSIVEDRDLYSMFHRNKMKISASEPFITTAHTYPCDSIKNYLQQMLRWSIGGFSFGSNLLLIGILFSLQNFLFLGSLMCCISGIPSRLAVANFFILWFFIFLTFRRTSPGKKALFFPFYFLFLIFESLQFPFLVLFRKKISWKGRDIS